MAHRLIAAMGLLALLGFGSDRLEERTLDGVGAISLPARATPVGGGEARDEDPARLYFRFAHEYGVWASMGSGTAYRQVLCVSLLAPDATPDDYGRWPPRFEPLYADLARVRELTLGPARLSISAGRYAQNALDEPAHVYVYSDPSRRLQIAWHVVDADVGPDAAIELLKRMAASFTVRTDPRAKFAEMRGRGAREAEQRAAAIRLARDVLSGAGFGAAAPGRPVHARGVYVEWMDEPEARFQLLAPLGLVRASGGPVTAPRLRDAQGQPRDLNGSVGWRAWSDGAWVTDNRDNAYLPLPGIDGELARLQADESTTLYYFATTVRVEIVDDDVIRSLGGFLEELPEVERAWQQGVLVPGERLALPAVPERTPAAGTGPPHDQAPDDRPVAQAGAAHDDCPRTAFGIDLHTGTAHLDALRRRLAAAACDALHDVGAGRFDAADARVLAVDRDIQSAVMLGAMYTHALREAVAGGARESRADYLSALHARALHWRLSAYPEPHTAVEADDYAAGRDADRAELAAILQARDANG